VQNRYGFGKLVNLSFDEALIRVTAELQKEGFGVLALVERAEIEPLAKEVRRRLARVIQQFP
jgi:uncharacterized protein (DUF302 family)